MSFVAQYRGECFDCGEQLKDTEVTYRISIDGDAELVHVQCPNGTGPLFGRPDAPLCAKCSTYHRGECI